MASIIKLVKGGKYLKVVHVCNANCHNAKLPDCDCLCNGQYHGVARKKGSPVTSKTDALVVLGIQARIG